MLTMFTFRALEKTPARLVATNFCDDETGATAIEYSLIVGMIFLAILGAVNSFGDSTNAMYTTIDTTISDAVN